MKSEKGFTIIGVMVGMAMLSVVGLAIYKEGTRYVLESKVDKLYAGYHGLDDALDHYVKRNWRSLIANRPITGVASLWAPTIPELVKQGYLDAFVPTKFTDAGQLSYTITVLPSGCDLSTAQCNIAYLIQPIKGVANEELADVLLRRIGASGLMTDPQNVNLARSWGDRRTMASPVAVPNAVFITRVFPASQLAATLPQDGSRPLTGDWDLGTKKMTGVGTYSTDTLTFTKTVAEGTPCTNDAGYKSLTMGTNHYLQICKGGVWVHANEDVTVIVDTLVTYHPQTCSATGGVVSCSGGIGNGSQTGPTLGGFLGPDGKVYPSPLNVKGDPPMPDGTKIIGDTNEQRANVAAAQQAAVAAAAAQAAAEAKEAADAAAAKAVAEAEAESQRSHDDDPPPD